jgi:hypothetical protein
VVAHAPAPIDTGASIARQSAEVVSLRIVMGAALVQRPSHAREREPSDDNVARLCHGAHVGHDAHA